MPVMTQDALGTTARTISLGTTIQSGKQNACTRPGPMRLGGEDTTKVISVYNRLFLEGAFGVSTPQLCLIHDISRRRTRADYNLRHG